MLQKKTLAESLAEDLEEAILSGTLKPGEAMPTEEGLVQAYGVSKAVVRDAARILAAKGLIHIKHGKGMFVTENEEEGFADALLLALRRRGASVWDVEQAELILYAEAAALIAARADDVDFDALRTLVEVYGQSIAQELRREPISNWFHGDVERAWRRVMTRLFLETGNSVLAVIGPAVGRLRTSRQWDGEDNWNPDEWAENETRDIRAIIAAMETGDPHTARRAVRSFLSLPQEAVEAMRATPVGGIPRIPIDLVAYIESKHSPSPDESKS